MNSKQESAGYGISDEDLVSFLRLAITFIFAASAVFLVVLLISAPEQPIRVIGPVLLSVVAALTYCFLLRRQLRIAMWVLGFGIWIQTTAIAIITGGVRAPAIFQYPLIILMAGWLLGSRFAYLFTGLSVLAGVGLVLLESRNILPSPATPATMLWFVEAGTFIFTAIIISMLVRSYRARLREVGSLGADLARQMADQAEREKRLRLMAENVPAMIFYGGPDQRCRFANRAYAEFFGFTPGTIVGKHAMEILGEASYEVARPSLERALAGERTEVKGSRPGPGGSSRILDITLVPEIGPDGTVEGFYAVKRDITEQERAAQNIAASEASYRGLFNSVQDRKSVV